MQLRNGHLQDLHRSLCALHGALQSSEASKATLAVVNATTSKGEKTSKKASQKPKEGMAPADAIDPELHAECEKDLNKAKKASETTKNKKESTT